MDGFKEFQGKDLDAAIQDACLYFNASRERLEIEILQDAKSGIFGIVGARKAKIRARRACLRDTVQSVLGELSGHTIKKTGSPGDRGEKALPDPARRTARSDETDQSQDYTASVSPETARSRQRRTQGQTARTEGRAEDRTDNRTAATAPSEASAASGASGTSQASTTSQSSHDRGKSEYQHPNRNRKTEHRSTSRQGNLSSARQSEKHSERTRGREQQPGRADIAARAETQPVEPADEACEDGLSHRPLDKQDLPLLEAPALHILHMLLAPLTGEQPRLVPSITNGAFSVSVQGLSDPSLLIGRDGATLMALQHLASRLLSRAVQRGVRVLLEVESLREQQEEELRQLAQSLAARVRETGKTLSTRPLRSSQRRIVHLCLGEMDDIQTRSAGTGGLKRVLVFPRKTAARQEESQAQSACQTLPTP
ncbi:MAG TPA: Jag N-terminal domain-containing protein [Candidatus Desulfovibrio intestinipullorum]|uniref:RNA-binding protein KhpB n=1 Tax=Candidatus Desulfovibrio intestinipullorum TaxID=2838536 RepID=A0A9D1PXF5_9BACT|nr:Jag N-terminal domain-containing protein [Candidatus Desulfovibrio intestinipullorum]